LVVALLPADISLAYSKSRKPMAQLPVMKFWTKVSNARLLMDTAIIRYFNRRFPINAEAVIPPEFLPVFVLPERSPEPQQLEDSALVGIRRVLNAGSDLASEALE